MSSHDDIELENIITTNQAGQEPAEVQSMQQNAPENGALLQPQSISPVLQPLSNSNSPYAQQGISDSYRLADEGREESVEIRDVLVTEMPPAAQSIIATDAGSEINDQELLDREAGNVNNDDIQQHHQAQDGFFQQEDSPPQHAPARGSMLRRIALRAKDFFLRNQALWVITFVAVIMALVSVLVDLGIDYFAYLKQGVCVPYVHLSRRMCCALYPTDLSLPQNSTVPLNATITGNATTVASVPCPNFKTWAALFFASSGASPTVYAGGFYVANYAMYILFALVFATIAVLLVEFIAVEAGGSGLPETKAILNSRQLLPVQRFFSFKTFLVKIVSLIFAVSASLTIGKVGPLVHISAAFGHAIGRLFPKYRLHEKKLRELMSVCTGIGVAVSFNAPIAGTLFALELSTYFSPRIMYRTFIGSALAATILRIVNYRQLIGDLSNNVFTIGTSSNWFWFELPFFILIGVLCGILGAVQIYINGRVLLFKKRFAPIINKYHLSLIEAVLLTLVTTLAIYWNPFSRVPLSGLLKTLLTNTCGASTSSAEMPMKELCASVDWWPWGQLLISGIIWYLFFLYTNGVRVAGGIVLPSLVIGSIFGQVVGIALRAINLSYGQSDGYFAECGREGLKPGTCVVPGLFSMVGAIAMLSAVTHNPSSSLLLVLEQTAAIQYILPGMIGAVLGRIVAQNIFRDSLFHFIIRMRGYDFLPNNVDIDDDDGTIAKIMTPVSKIVVLHLDATWSAAELEEIVQKAKSAHGFPVVRSADNMLLVGYIQRDEIQKLINQIKKSPEYEVVRIGFYSLLNEINAVSVSTAPKVLPPPVAADLSSSVDTHAVRLSSDTPISRLYELLMTWMHVRCCLITSNSSILEGICTKTDLVRWLRPIPQYKTVPEIVREKHESFRRRSIKTATTVTQ